MNALVRQIYSSQIDLGFVLFCFRGEQGRSFVDAEVSKPIIYWGAAGF